MIARALNVSRIHTVAWPLLIAWPLAILFVAFAIPWVVFALIDATESNTTGSIYSILGVTMAFYLGAMTQTFPFALGLGVTRRDFFNATVLVGAGQVAAASLLLWVLAVIEDHTDGWGVRMEMFGLPADFTGNPLTQLATYAAFLSLVACVGLLLGAVYQRWRVTGIYTAGTAFLLVGGLAAILVSWQRWWPEVGSWFADTPRVVPMVALPATVALAALIGAWTTIRRATP
ncbi:ABC transporter permease [Nocardia sp. NBC_01329]|uniref:ABC transporter permease n=1 Tax=Nocardia sp. NBC_01329 TaxID=2903594 RepID=UPI002E154D4E|nr:ABC transporter permease [Nocardia sp. NBC_01329]